MLTLKQCDAGTARSPEVLPPKICCGRDSVFVWFETISYCFQEAPPTDCYHLDLCNYDSVPKNSRFFENKNNSKMKSTYLLHNVNHYRTSEKKNPDPDLVLTQLLDERPAQVQ